MLAAALISPILLISCGGHKVAAKANDGTPAEPEVGVVKAVRTTLHQSLSVSSELVPFQQIDVYAKESGFVRQLNVDYGTHVRAGQVMAVLEIPELRIQLEEDVAAIRNAQSEVDRCRNQLSQVEAQQTVAHLQYSRINTVATAKPGLVAQQEVDDWQGKDLAAQSQVAAASAAVQAAQNQLEKAKAQEEHDRAIFDYSKIVAPFTGVVTKRYANFGTLMQSGIGTPQALPLVQLSQDDLFRLVIPVAESYVPHIHIGDVVAVRVPSLDRTFPGKVARFSVDVEEETRTMHTEVDVPNPQRILLPGMYAEATLTVNLKSGVVSVPPEAVSANGERRSVWLVGEDGKAKEQPVTTGIETPSGVEIASGVQEGEMVVAGNRSRLRDGEAVRPKVIRLLQYDGDKDNQ